jgi:hypothetical protein
MRRLLDVVYSYVALVLTLLTLIMEENKVSRARGINTFFCLSSLQILSL